MRIDVNDSAATSPSIAGVRRPLPARRWRRARAYVRAARRSPTARRSRRVVLLIAMLLLISGFDLVFTLMVSQTESFEELNPLPADQHGDEYLMPSTMIWARNGGRERADGFGNDGNDGASEGDGDRSKRNGNGTNGKILTGNRLLDAVGR